MRAISQRRVWVRWSRVVLGFCLVLALVLSVLTAADDISAKPQKGKIITALKLQNADIHSVLSFLSEYGGINIVAAPAVDAQVTLNLQNVTWRQALDILLKTYSLSGVEEKGYIRVLPTQQFLQEQAILEKHRQDQDATVPLETAVIPVQHGTAKDLVQSIKSVISQRGTIDTDDRTNSLVIRDTPEHIDKVKRLVETLDKATNQIKIEAKLLEIESGALEELGLNWSMISRRSAQLVSGDKAEAEYNQYTDRVSDPVATYTFATVHGDFDFEGTISALVSDNKGKIIAHPEITTVDNTEAFIQMGQRIPIKQFDEAGNVVITFEEVGTILRVTPHITSENRILLKLRPERSSYTFDANGVIINTNNAETNVVVENGQTAVIGGLTTQVEMKIRMGLPILKDIPILNYLFSYTRTEVNNRDLVIFVTPTIVTEGASMGSVDQPPDEG